MSLAKHLTEEYINLEKEASAALEACSSDHQQPQTSSGRIDELIRSPRMLLRDMEAWGYQFKVNSKSPYFEGHEREDVVCHRNEFVDHFLDKKNEYFTVDLDGNWVIPEEKQTILIFHDESTFRSGEASYKRWTKNDGSRQFFNKGRGKSLMVSDWLVAHPSGPYFCLDENEWAMAIVAFPSLLNNNGVNYEPRSCTGSIIPGQEGYFDNDTILDQFERLFQMIQFKKAFNSIPKPNIEIVVDNARTHTAQTININDFRSVIIGFYLYFKQ